MDSSQRESVFFFPSKALNFKGYFSNATNLSKITGQFLPIHCQHA